MGTEFLVGFETEFVLLKPDADGSYKPINGQPWSSSRALPAGALETQVLTESVAALTAAGVEIEQYHAEAGAGQVRIPSSMLSIKRNLTIISQYEIVSGPMPPIQAADALIRTRDTIVNIASKYGLRATFAPRVSEGDCTSPVSLPS